VLTAALAELLGEGAADFADRPIFSSRPHMRSVTSTAC